MLHITNIRHREQIFALRTCVYNCFRGKLKKEPSPLKWEREHYYETISKIETFYKKFFLLKKYKLNRPLCAYLAYKELNCLHLVLNVMLFYSTTYEHHENNRIGDPSLVNSQNMKFYFPYILLSLISMK